MNIDSQEVATKHKDETQAAIEKHQRRLIDANIWRTCLSCLYWEEIPMSGRTMICGKFKQTPPPQVIVHGCREWDNDIPF